MNGAIAAAVAVNELGEEEEEEDLTHLLIIGSHMPMHAVPQKHRRPHRPPVLHSL